MKKLWEDLYRGDFIVDSPDKSAYIYMTFIQVEKSSEIIPFYE